MPPCTDADPLNIAENAAAVAKCGARTRAGHPCRNPRMRGRRRCRMHGGRSLCGMAHPGLRHGLYSKDPLTRIAGAYLIRREGRLLSGESVQEAFGPGTE